MAISKYERCKSSLVPPTLVLKIKTIVGLLLLLFLTPFGIFNEDFLDLFLVLVGYRIILCFSYYSCSYTMQEPLMSKIDLVLLHTRD